MRRMKTLASWCADIFLLILGAAFLLAILVLPPAETWNFLARKFGLPMLNSLRLLAWLIFLAAIAIITFFLYLKLQEKGPKIKRWGTWQQILRLVRAKVHKRG